MKISGLFILLFCTLSLHAQVAPFIDFNGYFRTFYHNNFRQIEFQRIQSFVAGDNLVAYIDNRGDLRVYDGEKVQTISNQILEYKISDYQIAWNIGQTLFTLEDGQKKILTMFGRNYAVTDSLIVFEDTRFNMVNVYYRGQILPLYTVTGDLYMPDYIGENLLAFKDNGEFYKVFWQGHIYDIGVWQQPVTFSAGTDMIAFNDPTQKTFAVFEKGTFVDVEPMYVHKFKAGRGFAVYEDLNGNLNYYAGNDKHALTNFSATFWDTRDDIVVWGENNMVYTFYQGKKTLVSSYKPKDYKIKNGIYAFRNLQGGVSAFIDGEVQEITTQTDALYEIYGNLVLVELFNKSFIVLKDGRKFEAL